MTRKPRILFVCALLLALLSLRAAAAGGDTLFFVDFQNQQLPAGWINLDRDSLMDANGRPAAWYTVADGLGDFLGTNYAAASSSWFNPGGTADNWLISAPIIVTDSNLYLIWKSAPFEGPVYMDGYEVLVSTSGADPDSFTTQIAQISEGIGATAQPGPGSPHTSYFDGRGMFQEWQASLGAWMGDTIRIAFHHHSTDDNFLLLDDILAKNLHRFDAAALTANYSTEYTIFPRSQAQLMTFAGTAGNRGADTLANIAVNTALDLNGNPLFIASDTTGTLGPFQEDGFSIPNGFQPFAPGEYLFIVVTEIDSVDGDSTNDGAVAAFTLSDSLYGRDAGNVVDVATLDGTLEMVGTLLRIYVPDTTTGACVYLHNGGLMDTLRLNLYAMVLGEPGNLLLRSKPYVAPGGFSGWVCLDWDGADTRLPAGEYLLAVEGGNIAPTEIGIAGGKYTAGKAWRRINGVWANADLLGRRDVYMVRLSLGKVVNFVGTAAPAAWGAQLSPNPTTGRVQIDFAQPLPKAGTLIAIGLDGRTVLTQEIHPGVRGIHLDLGGLPAGLYLIECRAGEAVWQEKVLLR